MSRILDSKIIVMKSLQILAGYTMRQGSKQSHRGTTDTRKIGFRAEIAHNFIPGNPA